MSRRLAITALVLAGCGGVVDVTPRASTTPDAGTDPVAYGTGGYGAGSGVIGWGPGSGGTGGTANTGGTGGAGNASGSGGSGFGGSGFGGSGGSGFGGSSGTCDAAFCPSDSTGMPCCLTPDTCGIDYGSGCQPPNPSCNPQFCPPPPNGVACCIGGLCGVDTGSGCTTTPTCSCAGPVPGCCTPTGACGLPAGSGCTPAPECFGGPNPCYDCLCTLCTSELANCDSVGGQPYFACAVANGCASLETCAACPAVPPGGATATTFIDKLLTCAASSACSCK